MASTGRGHGSGSEFHDSSGGQRGGDVAMPTTMTETPPPVVPPREVPHFGCEPVLFVDIDGVLNISASSSSSSTSGYSAGRSSTSAFSALHVSLVDRLACVVRRSRARVVLSSSWRHDRQRMKLLERAWCHTRLPAIHDETPTLATADAVAASANQNGASRVLDAESDLAAQLRVLEIHQWLRAHGRDVNSSAWMAIDDLDLASAATATTRGTAKEERTASFHFVQTDSKRGITSHDIDTMVHTLRGGSLEAEEDEELRQPLPAGPQLVQIAMDLIVVGSYSCSHVAVIDSADFSVKAHLDTHELPIRAWLMAQEEHTFSFDRIIAIALMNPESTDSLTQAASLVSIPLVVPLAASAVLLSSPMAFAQSFVREIHSGCAADHTLAVLVDTVHARDLSHFDAQSATAELHDAGFSISSASHLVEHDHALVLRLLDVLVILKAQSLSRSTSTTSSTSSSTALALEICRLFPDPRDQPLRRVLSEYVARGEISSTATLQAIQAMARTTSSTLSLEELDELLGCF